MKNHAQTHTVSSSDFDEAYSPHNLTSKECGFQQYLLSGLNHMNTRLQPTLMKNQSNYGGRGQTFGMDSTSAMHYIQQQQSSVESGPRKQPRSILSPKRQMIENIVMILSHKSIKNKKEYLERYAFQQGGGEDGDNTTCKGLVNNINKLTKSRVLIQAAREDAAYGMKGTSLTPQNADAIGGWSATQDNKRITGNGSALQKSMPMLKQYQTSAPRSQSVSLRFRNRYLGISVSKQQLNDQNQNAASSPSATALGKKVMSITVPSSNNFGGHLRSPQSPPNFQQPINYIALAPESLNLVLSPQKKQIYQQVPSKKNSSPSRIQMRETLLLQGTKKPYGGPQAHNGRDKVRKIERRILMPAECTQERSIHSNQNTNGQDIQLTPVQKQQDEQYQDQLEGRRKSSQEIILFPPHALDQLQQQQEQFLQIKKTKLNKERPQHYRGVQLQQSSIEDHQVCQSHINHAVGRNGSIQNSVDRGVGDQDQSIDEQIQQTVNNRSGIRRSVPIDPLDNLGSDTIEENFRKGGETIIIHDQQQPSSENLQAHSGSPHHQKTKKQNALTLNPMELKYKDATADFYPIKASDQTLPRSYYTKVNPSSVPIKIRHQSHLKVQEQQNINQHGVVPDDNEIRCTSTPKILNVKRSQVKNRHSTDINLCKKPQTANPPYPQPSKLPIMISTTGYDESLSTSNGGLGIGNLPQSQQYLPLQNQQFSSSSMMIMNQNDRSDSLGGGVEGSTSQNQDLIAFSNNGTTAQNLDGGLEGFKVEIIRSQSPTRKAVTNHHGPTATAKVMMNESQRLSVPGQSEMQLQEDLAMMCDGTLIDALSTSKNPRILNDANTSDLVSHPITTSFPARKSLSTSKFGSRLRGGGRTLKSGTHVKQIGFQMPLSTLGTSGTGGVDGTIQATSEVESTKNILTPVEFNHHQLPVKVMTSTNNAFKRQLFKRKLQQLNREQTQYSSLNNQQSNGLGFGSTTSTFKGELTRPCSPLNSDGCGDLLVPRTMAIQQAVRMSPKGQQERTLVVQTRVPVTGGMNFDYYVKKVVVQRSQTPQSAGVNRSSKIIHSALAGIVASPTSNDADKQILIQE